MGAVTMIMAFGITGMSGTVLAGEIPTVEELGRALQAKPLTRSLRPATSNKTRELKVLIKKIKTRKITVEQRSDLVKLVKQAAVPSVDLEINFAYNSAAITPQSVPVLVNLGKVLSTGKLGASTILINGHTDARGSNEYNLKLSTLRANAVKHFLESKFGVNPSMLLAVGYGEEQLKLPSEPDSGVNRRVQIVNIAR